MASYERESDSRSYMREEEEEAPVLHISGLTRNVAEPHLREIFGSFGRIKSLTLALDPVCGLSKGYAIIMYENSKYAEDAYVVMNGGQIDGNYIRVNFVTVKKKEADRERSDRPIVRDFRDQRERDRDRDRGFDRDIRDRDRDRSDRDRDRPDRAADWDRERDSRPAQPPMRDWADSKERDRGRAERETASEYAPGKAAAMGGAGGAARPEGQQ